MLYFLASVAWDHVMRTGIISDIHGNLAAFEAVLRHIETVGGVDEIWCLGDLVGYGPSPNECIELLQQTKHVCVLGNHDFAAIGLLPLEDFNPDAAGAARWTIEHLSEASMQYLKQLPHSIVRGDFTLVHGSPRDPVWEYLLSLEVAAANFALLETFHGLMGHTHVPVVFEYDSSFEESDFLSYPEEGPLLLSGRRLMLNPGSVGQPRDGDPRAAYLLYDQEAQSLRHFRVAYDVAATQRLMLESKLPERLADRLTFGW